MIMASSGPTGGLGHKRSVSLSMLGEEPPPAYPGPAASAFTETTEISGPTQRNLPHSSSLDFLNTISETSQFRLVPTAPGPSALSGAQSLPRSGYGMSSQELLYQTAAPRLNPLNDNSNVAVSTRMSYQFQPPYIQAPIPYEPPINVHSQPLIQPITPSLQESGVHQSHYYAVYYNPESEELYMSIDGQYRPLPKRISNGTLLRSQPSAPAHPPLQLQSSLRPSSEQLAHQNVQDYYKCTIAMVCMFVLCLDLLFLAFCLCPALWFARKAKKAKAHHYYNEAERNGRLALYLNIMGGIMHILFIVVVILVPSLLYWVFEIF